MVLDAVKRGGRQGQFPMRVQKGVLPNSISGRGPTPAYVKEKILTKGLSGKSLSVLLVVHRGSVKRMEWPGKPPDNHSLGR